MITRSKTKKLKSPTIETYSNKKQVKKRISPDTSYRNSPDSSVKLLNNTFKTLAISPNDVSTNFWKIANIVDVHKEDKKLLQRNKKQICEASGQIEHIPFFADIQDIESIQGKKLVTSAIINMYTNHIQKTISKKEYIILHSELYYEFVQAVENNEDLEGFHDGYLKVLKGNLGNKKIILPINLDNKHWIFSMFDPKQKKIYVLDPYGYVNKNVFKYLQILWRLQTYKPDIIYEPVYHIDDLPKQPPNDTTSCGVFTSMYIAYILYKNEFPTKDDFTSRDIPKIRKYIFNIIINNICNFS
jgi:hypothetical protein